MSPHRPVPNVSDLAAPPANGARDEARERQLVERIRSGDREAFSDLMRMYHRPLRAYIVPIVRSEAVAEELVQDLFLDFWRLRERRVLRSSLANYLFSAIHKRALNDRRRAELFERWDRDCAARGEPPMMGTVSDPADRRVETQELLTMLRQTIQQLPPRCAQVATLRFQYDMTWAEVAQAMGITVKAVEAHAARALQVLRATMRPYLDR